MISKMNLVILFSTTRMCLINSDRCKPRKSKKKRPRKSKRRKKRSRLSSSSRWRDLRSTLTTSPSTARTQPCSTKCTWSIYLTLVDQATMLSQLKQDLFLSRAMWSPTTASTTTLQAFKSSQALTAQLAPTTTGTMTLPTMRQQEATGTRISNR